MIIRSRAPLRIGLAGGGTDIYSYYNQHNGAVLNATISMFAYATLEPLPGDTIEFHSVDRDITASVPARRRITENGKLGLIKAVYNRIVKDFTHKPLSFRLTTYVDVPPGSGLGSSSSLVVAVVGAFVEWLKLPLGEYDIAELAYEIERIDMKMHGGKQDHFSATFGNFNFIEFFPDEKVIVNPLRIRQEYIKELEFEILLYYSNISRYSSTIIKQQENNVREKNVAALQAMHNLKSQAFQMKEAILKGEFDKLGSILEFGWNNKKKMAKQITNRHMDRIYQTAKEAGVAGGKISGAGGGGFFTFFCPGTSRYRVIESLQVFGGEFRRFNFTQKGLTTWTLNEDKFQ